MKWQAAERAGSDKVQVQVTNAKPRPLLDSTR